MGLRREGGPSDEHQEHGGRTAAAQSLRLLVAKRGGSGAQDVVVIRAVIAKRVHVDQYWHQGLRFWRGAKGGGAQVMSESRGWYSGSTAAFFFEGPYRIRAELLVAGDGTLLAQYNGS